MGWVLRHVGLQEGHETTVRGEAGFQVGFAVVGDLLRLAGGGVEQTNLRRAVAADGAEDNLPAVRRQTRIHAERRMRRHRERGMLRTAIQFELVLSPQPGYIISEH